MSFFDHLRLHKFLNDSIVHYCPRKLFMLNHCAVQYPYILVYRVEDSVKKSISRVKMSCCDLQISQQPLPHVSKQ